MLNNEMTHRNVHIDVVFIFNIDGSQLWLKQITNIKYYM